jgi:hypothetical protein
MLKNAFFCEHLNFFPEAVKKQVGFLTINFAIDGVIQSSNIAAGDNSLEERGIKRMLGVF